MKRPILLVVISLLLAASLATTTVVADEPQPKAAAAQRQPGQTSRYGMMGRGRTTEGMMSSPMMSGMGMMAVCPAMMSDLDSKTRGQMMQIQGKMMTEMGELMTKRGKEIEQGK
jgi:hypothetical protein